MFKARIKKLSDFANRNRVIDIFILVIVVVIAYRGWFKPGFLEHGDWWVRPKEALQSFFSFPYIWQSNCWFQRLGGYGALTLYIYPVFWLYGLIAHLGFDFAAGERVLYFFPYLFLSIFSMYYFTYILFKNRIVCFFSSILYVFNTYIITLIAGGIIATGVAYALAPLILAFFVKGLKENRFRNGLLCGILLAVSVCYDPRITYLTIGAAAIFFAGHIGEQLVIQRLKSLKKITISFTCPIVALTILIILHFYWLLPSLLVHAPSLPSGYELAGGVTALSYMKLNHAAALYIPIWRGTLEFQQVRPLFYLIPLLVGTAVVLHPKNRKVIILTILAILSVFLVKGSNPPFGSLYIWLFKYFPGFKWFRDPSKFYCLVCLAYAPLLGVAIDSIASLFKPKTLNRTKFRFPLYRTAFLVLTLLFLLYLVFPLVAGKMFGTFRAHRVPSEYQKIEEFIKSQPPHFRTLCRPIKGRYAFYSQQYPIFPSIGTQVSLRFFLDETYNPGAFKETKYIAKILGLLNIKYCILPQEKYAYEIFGKDLNKDFFISTFQKQMEMKKIDIGENIDIFENEYYAPRFFATSHAALVVGGRKALLRLASLRDMDLSRWALYFADELRSHNLYLLNNVEAVVFYDRDMDDLVLASVGNDYRFDLSSYAVRADEATKGKWQRTHPAPADVYGHRYGEITHNPGGTIRAFNHAELTIPVNILKADTCEIWLRAGTGPKNGKLSVASVKSLSEILTYNDNFDNHRWKEDAYSYKGFYESYEGGSYAGVLSSAKEGGVSELVYKVDSPRPLKSIQIEWETLFIPTNQVVGKLFVSHEGKEWTQVGEPLTEDAHPYSPHRVDASAYVSGWEHCYLKYQFNAPEGRSALLAKIGYHYKTMSVNELIRNKDLKSKEHSFQWIKGNTVCLNKGQYLFSITNEDGIGILDQLIIVPQSVMDTLRQEISKRIQLKKVVFIEEGKDISVYNEFFKVEEGIPLAWKMINPTKYEVKLKTEKPTYLVFSETFDSYWTLKLSDPISSLSAYSVLNSFFIPKPGKIEAILEYTPQRYVYAGFLVSSTGLALICCYFIFKLARLLKRNKSKK